MVASSFADDPAGDSLEQPTKQAKSRGVQKIVLIFSSEYSINFLLNFFEYTGGPDSAKKIFKLIGWTGLFFEPGTVKSGHPK